jgi:ABC-type multidrug transport system ATPase subunit
VTALLGDPGAGKSTALALMLELAPGRGLTLFRGRPLHRVAQPAREIGTVLGDVPGHPARSLLGHLRMLCAAAGVPAQRAGEVLALVGLTGLGDQRLDSLSLGMDRRLGLATALIGDPHTLLLDEPADGLPPRESAWLHGMLRAHSAHGGTVLFTTSDAKQAARHADRVLVVDEGRLVADLTAADFARTRLRPHVAVSTPHAARLAAVLAKEARAGHRSVEVVAEDGGRLTVYGSDCADIGEAAYRHGVLLHRLAEGTGLTETPAARPALLVAPHGFPLPAPAPTGCLTPTPLSAPTTVPVPAPTTVPVPPTVHTPGTVPGATAVLAPAAGHAAPAPVHRPAGPVRPPAPHPVPPLIQVRQSRAPLHPLRYELHRVAGVRTLPLVVGVSLLLSVLLAAFAARGGHTPLPRLLVAWPAALPLPPAALGAGLLGALAFGEEFRYPALAAHRGNVPRRLGLLLAKLAVSAATALLLALLSVLADGLALHLLYSTDFAAVTADPLGRAARWAALMTGCAWAGLLAAGICRSTTAGLAAVLAVPVAVVPVVQRLLSGPSVRSMAGLPARLREFAAVEWPAGADRWLLSGLRVLAQPVGAALLLSLAALTAAYLFTALRGRVR